MPELPEVESLVRSLRPVEGNRIARVSARDDRVFEPPLSPGGIEKRLVSRRVHSLQRFGKYLLIGVDGGSLLFSLRMTGQFYRVPEPPVDPDTVKLILGWEEDGTDLVFTSVRRLSRVHWIPGTNPAESEKLARLGPDPLRDDYTPDALRASLEGRRGPLKSLLMDQSFVAGVGNIYASELCFLIGVHPERTAPDLLGSERRRLFRALPRLLRKAVITGGSSFRDFRAPDGSHGGFQRYFQVYDREDEPCVHCGTPVRRITMAGRSTFFCPTCQE